MKLRNLALVAAGMVFLACTSFAQITTVEGDVKGTDGKPVQNAQIKITRTDIKGNYDTKTNKKGHYIYMGLPMGTYNIALFVDGKEVDKVNGVRTSPGDAEADRFRLEQVAAGRSRTSRRRCRRPSRPVRFPRNSSAA